MLLAILDGIAHGTARPDHVPWSNWLRERFRTYFELVRVHNDDCTPENPFFYLRSDGFFEPVRMTPTSEVPLETTPLARDLDTGHVFGRFTNGWGALVAKPVNRIVFRDALISRYFPHARQYLESLFIEPLVTKADVEPTTVEESTEEVQRGRSSGFRRRILEIYDFQCVACELRIWMPEQELSFVDAAHLVPFSETRNDHPTNGLALCKNHHWALDQRLIAPDQAAIWRVSPILDPRRSRGEEELARLNGQPLLRPADSAFAPDPAGLKWRFTRLLA